MKSLLIDTHLYDIHMLLLENGKVFKEEHVINEKHNSTFLVPTLKKLCDKETYDEIIVVNGPGSFTGVRLGVTIAKTLAYTQKIPIKVISYFDLMAYSLDENEYLFGINDGNGYFVGHYKNYKPIEDLYYSNDKDIANIKTNVAIDYQKAYEHIKNLSPENPHGVKPIYIKLIGVEYDNKNN